MRKEGRTLACVLAVLLIVFTGSRPAEERGAGSLPPAANVKVDFERDIAPILQRCQMCHGAELQQSGLRLDSRVAALKGGKSGRVIQPGNSAESKLIHLVAGIKEKLVMPPQGERLTAEEVGLLRAWIDQDVVWPEARASGEAPRARSRHWAFIPPRRPQLPAVRNRAWVRNPADAFVLARLEAEGIQPSPEADKVTLIRRASLDLIGLPPSPADVEAFVADRRPDAYERLVDRLLASPHYGEKWARHWLDLARYADSDGYEKDGVRPYAWRWRHWVIEALNRNVPFDRFTIEQIAGDLLPDATVEQKVATGFHRNTLTSREGGTNRDQLRVDQVADRTNTLGTVWLGMTVGCARCHDHKYDPISQKDYYQLYAFFNNAAEIDIEAPLLGEIGPFLQGKAEYDKKRRELLAEYKVPELLAEWERKTLEASTQPGVEPEWTLAWEVLGWELDYGQEILRLEPSRRTQKQQDKLTDHFLKWYGLVVNKEQYEQLKFKELIEKLEKLSEEYPPLSEAQIIAEASAPSKTYVHIRGDYRDRGAGVQPNTPAVLPPLPQDSKPSRLSLARWLVSKENPLTARVRVNRMWQEFFGHGLVATSDDFGTRGERPTHPELLDWLASEFMSDWNVKRMHRLMVTSATYRQSSKVRKDLESRDPDNRLLARQSRLRLPAESVRDAALAASGLLNPAIGGKSVRPPQPAGVADLGVGGSFGGKWQESKGPDRYRRGLYVLFQRTTPYPQLMNFDAPDSLLTCTRRERSTTPLQALNLLNDPVFFEAAQAMAVRILREKPGTLSDRIDYAFQISLGRKPRPRERERLIGFYEAQKKILTQEAESTEKLFPVKSWEGVDPSEAAAWVGVSRVLLNLDEFITRS